METCSDRKEMWVSSVEQSKKEMPMTLYVSTSSGLPLKIEMSQREGSMCMEYYDFNAPITIDVPACLKK